MKKLGEKTKRGLLIVFEGVDRAGKSTQLQMLKNYFLKTRKEMCQHMQFPGNWTNYLVKYIFFHILKRSRNKNWEGNQ